MPPSNSALATTLSETLAPPVPAVSKQPAVKAKPSNNSLHSSVSNPNFKSSVSSNSGRPKVLDLAAKKKKEQERELQRKQDQKREIQERRAAQQEEERRQEEGRRREAERQQEREESKKAAQKQAAEKRRLEHANRSEPQRNPAGSARPRSVVENVSFIHIYTCFHADGRIQKLQQDKALPPAPQRGELGNARPQLKSIVSFF